MAEHETLKQIINGIKKKELILPNFQREFVWKHKAQKDLLASVLCDIPASASLLVETNQNNEQYFSCIEIGKRKSEIKKKDLPLNWSYILDGQQRFTTLYYSLFDVFSKSTLENTKILSEIHDKLHSRWFLKLKVEDYCIFNSDTLLFEKKQANKYLPKDIIPYISYVKCTNASFDVTKYKGYDKLRKYCIKNRCLPLQLFLTEEASKIKTILKKIQSDIRDEILNEEKEKEVLINILTKLGCLDSKSIVEKHHKGDEDSKGVIETYLENDKFTEWYEEVYDHLKGQIEQYKINPIKLNDILKAISTFEYINTGGTKLSTFDLLCAKSGFDLRKEVIQETIKPFTFINNSYSEEKKYILNNNFEFIDDNDSIEGQYAEFISQVLNLLHFRETYDNDLLKKDNGKFIFSTDVQKAEYSLNKLNSKFIQNNYKEAVSVIKKSSAILQVFCSHKGHKSITNKLILLPIFTYFIYHDVDKELEEKTIENNDIKKLISFFWLKLFSARYDRHQNNHAKDDCIEVFKYFINKDQDVSVVWKRIINDRVLQVEDFATKDLMCKQKCNSSLESNFYMYLRSIHPKFYDWENPNKELVLGEDIDIHHIFPLFSGLVSMKENTKTIRADKSHQLNATMNKTPISKSVNMKIGAKTPHQYANDIPSLAIAHHLITDDWFDKTKVPKSLFEIRFDSFKSILITDLDNKLSS